MPPNAAAFISLPSSSACLIERRLLERLRWARCPAIALPAACPSHMERPRGDVPRSPLLFSLVSRFGVLFGNLDSPGCRLCLNALWLPALGALLGLGHERHLHLPSPCALL